MTVPPFPFRSPPFPGNVALPRSRSPLYRNGERERSHRPHPQAPKRSPVPGHREGAMTNRQRPLRRTCLDDLAAVIGDQRVRGGCDDCDAYQTMTKLDGIFHITVHHDDYCPWLAARETTHPKGEPQ